MSIKNKISIALVCMITLSCSKQDGMLLQELKIKNYQLDSLALLYTNGINKLDIENPKNKCADNELIPVVIFNYGDSVIKFTFTYREKNEIANSIIMHNFRIIGFCNNEYKEDLILLVDSKIQYSKLDYILDPFVSPTNNLKKFKNIINLKFRYYDNVEFMGNKKLVMTMLHEEHRKFLYFYKNGKIYPCN